MLKRKKTFPLDTGSENEINYGKKLQQLKIEAFKSPS